VGWRGLAAQRSPDRLSRRKNVATARQNRQVELLILRGIASVASQNSIVLVLRKKLIFIPTQAMFSGGPIYRNSLAGLAAWRRRLWGERRESDKHVYHSVTAHPSPIALNMFAFCSPSAWGVLYWTQETFWRRLH
jgi:hypothetical protein